MAAAQLAASFFIAGCIQVAFKDAGTRSDDAACRVYC